MSIVTRYCVVCDACGLMFAYGGKPNHYETPEKAEVARRILHTQFGWVEAAQQGKDLCPRCLQTNEEYASLLGIGEGRE